MSDMLIARTPSAYDYPLLIKNLLLFPMVDNPDQEIVYRDLYRGNYRQFRERVARLDALLASSPMPALALRAGKVLAEIEPTSTQPRQLQTAEREPT